MELHGGYRIMKFKEMLKTSKVTHGMYLKYKNEKNRIDVKNKLKCNYKYINRSSGKEKLCIILAGYKEFLYDSVFGRIKKFITSDIDVCVVTSGLYSDTVAELCATNNWSYLSTKENNVSLVQNVAISLHKKAKFIFKLDEDVFVTKGYFDNMLRAYEHASNEDYNPGVLAPILNINGFAHLLLLKKLKLESLYANMFELPKYAAGRHRQVESNPDVAKFFWGEGGYIPSIDYLNEQFSNMELVETACPIRFSIGAILFTRSLWREMGYFKVNRNSNNMGADEVQICSYCLEKSRPLMVSENIVVGHLSFGNQNEAMKDYYIKNKRIFEVPNN